MAVGLKKTKKKETNPVQDNFQENSGITGFAEGKISGYHQSMDTVPSKNTPR